MVVLKNRSFEGNENEITVQISREVLPERAMTRRDMQDMAVLRLLMNE